MATMLQHKKEFNRWQRRYDAVAPKVGDAAPDFELRDAGGENPLSLSDFKGKRPVALVFGSFT